MPTAWQKNYRLAFCFKDQLWIFWYSHKKPGDGLGWDFLVKYVGTSRFILIYLSIYYRPSFWYVFTKHFYFSFIIATQNFGLKVDFLAQCATLIPGMLSFSKSRTNLFGGVFQHGTSKEVCTSSNAFK